MTRSPVPPSSPHPADPPAETSRLVRRFLGWNFLRAVLHNGWWLVVSLYMVVDAHLSPAQLLLVAAAQGVASFVFEVPAGVLADTVSRKRALLVSHALMGGAMVLTGLVESFGLLLVSQVLWGISWTFASGSDVAWATDELDQPERIHLVLAAQARWQAIGAGVGIVVLGGLATLVGRPAAIVGAGVGMLALGVAFGALLPERRFIRVEFIRVEFTRVERDHVRAALGIARRGLRLAAGDRTILVLLVVAVLVNGAGDSFGRIYPVRLAALGLPVGRTGTAWFTVLSLAGFAVAAVALAIAQRRLHSDRGARGTIAVAGTVGMGSAFLLALTAGVAPAVVGVVLMAGVANPLLRIAATVLLNRRTTSDVRATMHSFLAQAEYVGEVACALGLAALSRGSSSSGPVVVTGVLLGLAAAVVLLARPGRGRYRPSSPTAR